MDEEKQNHYKTWDICQQLVHTHVDIAGTQKFLKIEMHINCLVHTEVESQNSRIFQGHFTTFQRLQQYQISIFMFNETIALFTGLQILFELHVYSSNLAPMCKGYFSCVFQHYLFY